MTELTVVLDVLDAVALSAQGEPSTVAVELLREELDLYEESQIFLGLNSPSEGQGRN